MNLIGNKITIKINERDYNCKIIENKFAYVTGICYFYGYNEILNVEQITLGRCPIFPFNKKDIVKIE